MQTNPQNLLFECRGYRLTMKPQRCIENQLSDYCLPGFPCHDCEAGVTIQIPPSPPLEKGGEIGAKVGRSHLQETPGPARNLPGSGKASLNSGKTRPYDPKTMSRAVARDLGLIS